MAKLIVTKKGSEVKGNDWKEGQEITCHENIAELFVKNGWAKSSDGEETKDVKSKTTTTTKKK